MAQNPIENATRTYSPVILWLDWIPKSPNRIKGVKDKIATWKQARNAVDSAFNSFVFDGGFLMNTTISAAPLSQSLTGSLSGSDSKPITTDVSNGTTAKSKPKVEKA